VLEIKFKEKYDLSTSLECGQLFRFRKIDGKDGDLIGPTYYGPLGDRILKIRQKDTNTLEIDSNINRNLSEIANKFLRASDDYTSMLKSIAINELMSEVSENVNGLHLFQQDKMECIISYFLSQNNNIPRITANLESICQLGGELAELDGINVYLFPSRERLMEITEENLRDMGCGYRAKYIAKFAQNIPEFIDNPPKLSEELNKKLLEIYGIGQKVADCIQLFAFGDLSVFPVDTWIAKFMRSYFFDLKPEDVGNTRTLAAQKNRKKKPNKLPSVKKIREKGCELFGKWAGYAGEFIFHYVRTIDPFFSQSKSLTT